MKIDGYSWKCSVCGFVSDTEEPPEICPVCGVPKEKFDAFVSRTLSETKTETSDLWRCMVCNHKHSGDTPPLKCPVCGVGSEKFESIQEENGNNVLNSNDNIVITGAGIAGLAAAEEIRRLSSTAEISLISSEKRLPYYRLNLTRYLAGEITEEALPVHPEGWYKANRIELLTGSEVVDVHQEEGCVELKGGKKIDYDKLILTAGAHPFVPPVPGADLKGVTTLRFFDDADYILSASQKGKSVVVIGGGVLGLEVSGALAAQNKGLNITLIEGFDYLMPRQLNKKAAAYLMTYMKGLGLNIVTATAVKEIRGNGHVEAIILENGEIVPADLVVFSVGVRPNRYLGGYCGLSTNHGVIVNDNMETSVPGIYAAGDIAEHRGTLYGLWNAAMFQGKIAGMNAAGKKTDFGGIPRSNTLKVLGIDLFSIGNFNPGDGSCMFMEEEKENDYAFFLFRDGKIEGAILFGDTSKSALVKAAIERKISFPASLVEKRDISGILKFVSEQI